MSTVAMERRSDSADGAAFYSLGLSEAKPQERKETGLSPHRVGPIWFGN